MGHVRTVSRALTAAFRDQPPQSVVELGAGDGTLLLQIAKKLPSGWKPSRVVLVDRQPLLARQTRAAFEALSWNVECVEMDVFDWFERSDPAASEVTIANLFLHHFADADRRQLPATRSPSSGLYFLVCEPERRGIALSATALLPLLGCNDVTRQDAATSVRAGFTDCELTELWPDKTQWQLVERRAGLFTHYFAARRAAL